MASCTYHFPSLGSSPSILRSAKLITSPPYVNIISQTESSADSQDSSTRTFTHFPDLPTELRLKIWELAIQDHRVIKIGAEPGWGGSALLKVSNPIPPLLHVNRESHEVALKIYTLSFSRQFCGKPIYFAYERDMLHFKDRSVFDAFMGYGWRALNREIDEKIKFLAIGPNASLPW